MTLVVNTEQQALAMRRHTTAADYVFTRLGYRYCATCTCGFTSRGTFADKAMAESIGRGHTVAEFVMDNAVGEYHAKPAAS
jgi:hypothetical protein